jgi:hypothetical protein
MNKAEIISYSTFLILTICILMTFQTKSVITSKLMASLIIISGTYTIHSISKKNLISKNEATKI